MASGRGFSSARCWPASYETGTSKEMKQLKNISTARSGICMIRHFLKGSREAVLLLKDKIKGQMPIRVIGDYDADGICSSYILKRGLEACGAVVDTMIPHRMKDGYGLNEHLVDEAYADGIDTILTCDNGMAAYAQIEQAKNTE